MNRGEIWWASVPGRAGERPVVLLSRQEASREPVAIFPVTTRIRGIGAEVSLGREEGLRRPCVANADVIHTVTKRCLRRRLATPSLAKARALDAALRYALGLE